jgi:zinc finger CCHC domain-containing protein 9
MVRFARAKGSKGANEKVPEDATPWWEMKAQLLDNQERDSDDNVLETNWKQVVDREEKTKQNQNSVWADFGDEEGTKKEGKKKKKKRNLEENGGKSLEAGPVSEETSETTEIRPKKLKKKDKERSVQNDEEEEAVPSGRKKSKLEPSDQDESVPDNENENKVSTPKNPRKEKQKFDCDENESPKEETPNQGEEKSVPQESRRNKQKTNKKLKGNKDFKRRKPDPGSFIMNINGRDVEIVRYEAFYIKKEDAQRLVELKKKLQMKGVSKKEIALTIKGERRRAEKALAREKKHVCFHCRQYGHNLSECPKLSEDSGNTQRTGSGICYKCGSTEHTYFQCKVRNLSFYHYHIVVYIQQY